MARTKLVNTAAMEKQPHDEYGRGIGKVYYDFNDFKKGSIFECNGVAMEITEVEANSQKILDEIAKVGGDLDKLDTRIIM